MHPGKRQTSSSLFRLWGLDHELVAEALPVAEDYRLRAGDTIHLATALQMASIDSGSSEVYVITSDRELIRASASPNNRLMALDPQASNSIQLLDDIRNPAR